MRPPASTFGAALAEQVERGFALFAPRVARSIAIPAEYDALLRALGGSFVSQRPRVSGLRLFAHARGEAILPTEGEAEDYAVSVQRNVSRFGHWLEIGAARDHHHIWLCVDRERDQFGAVCYARDDADYADVGEFGMHVTSPSVLAFIATMVNR